MPGGVLSPFPGLLSHSPFSGSNPALWGDSSTKHRRKQKRAGGVIIALPHWPHEGKVMEQYPSVKGQVGLAREKQIEVGSISWTAQRSFLWLLEDPREKI